MKLRLILRYLGVNTGNMEEGAMRCGGQHLPASAGIGLPVGTQVEVKNLNSFRAVHWRLTMRSSGRPRPWSRGGSRASDHGLGRCPRRHLRAEEQGGGA